MQGFEDAFFRARCWIVRGEASVNGYTVPALLPLIMWLPA